MTGKTVNNILADLKALDLNSITDSDLTNIAKQLSALRANKAANQLQEIRMQLKALDVSSLSITDKDFILDDVKNLITELTTFVNINE